MTNETRNYLKGILTMIEGRKYNEFNGNINSLSSEMVDMVGFKSYSGSQKGEVLTEFHEQRELVMKTIFTDPVMKKMPASILKEYIQSKMGQWESDLALIDRVNSVVDLYIKTLITIVSALKEEMRSLNYGSPNQTTT